MERVNKVSSLVGVESWRSLDTGFDPIFLKPIKTSSKNLIGWLTMQKVARSNHVTAGVRLGSRRRRHYSGCQCASYCCAQFHIALRVETGALKCKVLISVFLLLADETGCLSSFICWMLLLFSSACLHCARNHHLYFHIGRCNWDWNSVRNWKLTVLTTVTVDVSVMTQLSSSSCNLDLMLWGVWQTVNRIVINIFNNSCSCWTVFLRYL